MKHEFKVGELVCLKDGYGYRNEPRVGFIDKIASRHIYITKPDGDREGWTFDEFNAFFERATKIK